MRLVAQMYEVAHRNGGERRLAENNEFVQDELKGCDLELPRPNGSATIGPGFG